MVAIPKCVVDIAPEAVKIIETVSASGQPHGIVCGSIAIIGESKIAVGEVLMKRTKENLAANGKASILITAGPKSYELILENARKITDAGTRLIVRTPVIPTFNATKEEIGEIAKFASSLKGVTQMHILPYHRIGTDKYKGLGRDYSLTGIEPPSKELMNELLEVVDSYGLKGQIGG